MEKMKWGCGQKLRDSSWDGGNLSFEKDRAYGFSWPQRNYRCNFCKKEFKSAQALGGHMNVHRRDRARMRLSPSWDSPKITPNPNPNFSSSSSSAWSPSSTSAAKFLPYNSSSLTAVTTNLPSSGEDKVPVFEHSKNIDMKKVCRGERGCKNKGEMMELTRRDDGRVWKANGYVRLDLNMGLLQDAKEEDLDLELRLGYSN